MSLVDARSKPLRSSPSSAFTRKWRPRGDRRASSRSMAHAMRAQETVSPDYERGTLIGGTYRLESVLGEGGMGTVWLATNVIDGGEAAVKIACGGARDADLSARLLREACVGARLRHSALVRVSGHGHTPLGDPYLVMERLHGITLAALLAARGKLSEAAAVRTLLPVLDALDLAHRHGIVHRDLKPENIFLARCADGTQPKLIDFGIAHWHVQRSLTRRGELLGSAGYMAPEQLDGTTVPDARVDVWSACIVLYELVHGEPPFSGDDLSALFRATREHPIAPLVDERGRVVSLWRVIEPGLRKDRAQRLPSVRALSSALLRWQAHHDVICGGHPRQRSLRGCAAPH